VTVSIWPPPRSRYLTCTVSCRLQMTRNRLPETLTVMWSFPGVRRLILMHVRIRTFMSTGFWLNFQVFGAMIWDFLCAIAYAAYTGV
jgi:hypothetical protein